MTAGTTLSPSGDDAVEGGAFPPGFLWGVATSAYQIEGAADEGGRGPSIWDTFSRTPGAIQDGATGDVACDHYHRHAEDVALMRELGVTAYRFSIAWPRLLPTGTGTVNPEGVAFYRRLCEDLLAAGITPMATLYHWDLPQALQDRGGWLHPDSPGWFAAYAAVAKRELGDLVRWWATLNEPWCSAFLGHSAGIHAPGLTDPAAGLLSAHHLLLAHHAAVAELRATAPAPDDRLGVVLNLTPAWPAGEGPEDARAAARIDLVQNRLFTDAVLHGRYPDEVLALHARHRIASRIDLGALAAGRQELDWLGVNYYNVNHVTHRPGAPAPAAWPGADEAVIVRPPGPVTAMDWGIHPEGLTWTLRRVAEAAPGLPVVIGENGAAYHDVVGPDGEVVDTDRIAYLDAHLDALATALAHGVDVRGYFLWSLLDNFEWARGYTQRFGIVHVDFATGRRTLKASGRWYRDQIARHTRT